MQRSSTLFGLVFGAFAAFALVSLPACDDKKADEKAGDTKDAKVKADGTKAGDTKADAPKPEPTADGKKADVPAADGAAAGGGGTDKIGVAECDEYIEKYGKCIAEKVPEAQRQQMKDLMDHSVKTWKDAANGPAKGGLPTACKAALDAAKQATASMGCEF